LLGALPPHPIDNSMYSMYVTIIRPVTPTNLFKDIGSDFMSSLRIRCLCDRVTIRKIMYNWEVTTFYPS